MGAAAVAAEIPVLYSDLAKKAGLWVESEIDALLAAGKSIDGVGGDYDAKLAVLSRVVAFPFAEYPDYTAPWHLLYHEPMRWQHVFDLIFVIERLKQPTGSDVGGELRLEPFQVLMLLCIFGPEDAQTGLRLVREGLLTIARKNGKTSFVAAVATALMTLHPDNHGLKGQEIQVGAADREQSGITHGMVAMYGLQDTEFGLDTKFHSIPSKKTVTHTSTLTKLRCLSSDAYRAHGGNPCAVLLDEIGNVPSNQAQEFYSVLTTGFGAQAEPLTLLLSTQAPTDQHFFSQSVDHAKRVNEGAVEDAEFAGFVFVVPEVDDYGVAFDAFDEKWWYLGNPGIDSICSRKDLRVWRKKAQSLPSLQNKFENLRLNRRVSETAAFLSRRVWIENGAGFDKQSLFGRPCYMGVDLAETTDLTAVVLVFEEDDSGIMPVLPFFWIPGDGLLARVNRDKVPYDAWAREGLISAAPGSVVSYDLVASKIAEIMDDYQVLGFGVDRWKMKYLRKALSDIGLTWEKEDGFYFEIGQGFQDQTRSAQLLEEKALNKKLAHANNPILNWCMSNTVVVMDASRNRKFDKARSFGRIDGTVALSLALHTRDLLGIEGKQDSIYNDECRDMIM